MQLIVVSLIGIPASGKTTFAHKLVELSKQNTLNASVIVISFDDHIKMDFTKLTEGEYKNLREVLITKVEDALRLFIVNEQSNWTGILSSKKLITEESWIHLKNNFPTIVVLDDNMYFRSMRQRIRMICKNLKCQHFQILLNTSIDRARSRNQRRSQQVPELIIEKMFRKLEVPSNPRTIVIEEGQDNEIMLGLLHDRIENSEKLEETTEQQKIQQQSKFHEVDIITRKELSKSIKSLESSDFPAVCEALTRHRKEFLKGLKSKDLLSVEVDSLIETFRCFLDQKIVNYKPNKRSN